MSPRELLKMPYFDDIRILDNERSAPHKLKLQIDADQAFDYELGQTTKYSKKDYMQMVFQEAQQVHAVRELHIRLNLVP